MADASHSQAESMKLEGIAGNPCMGTLALGTVHFLTTRYGKPETRKERNEKRPSRRSTPGKAKGKGKS